MNMQAIMMQAKKMQKDIEKKQKPKYIQIYKQIKSFTELTSKSL